MVALLAFALGLPSLAVAVFFYLRRKQKLAVSVPARLQAVDIEERLGNEGDTWFYIVYEAVGGRFSGKRFVSELGHGKPPKLPNELQYARINPQTNDVITAASQRLEIVMIFAFAIAGIAAMAVSYHLITENFL